MASDTDFVAYVCEQARAAGISARKMFGEYALYCDGKVVALICDNQLFVKPTAAGRSLLTTLVEASPYPGAKPHWLISDVLEDAELLTTVLLATARELPLPKPKIARSRKQRNASR